MDSLDLPRVAREDYGIDAVEHVGPFFKDKVRDTRYLSALKQRAADHGVMNLLIVCDGEGDLGHAQETERKQAVENHYKWVEAAKYLDCHSIRVVPRGQGSYAEQLKQSADSLSRLAAFGAEHKIRILVENHDGWSAHGGWVASLIRTVNSPWCGTLVSCGNFDYGGPKEYDRYKGVEELMPFAYAVSAQATGFDGAGNEAQIDYRRLMKIIQKSPYRGHVAIVYYGSKLSEEAGVGAMLSLLLRLRDRTA